MTDVVYKIVEHDGGWAYKLGDVFSETFPSYQAAKGAADRVSVEQRIPGDTEAISWQDEAGAWHDEVESGSNRPDARVEIAREDVARPPASRLQEAITRHPIAAALMAAAFGYVIGVTLS